MKIAKTEVQKQQRRQDILTAARQLLATTDIQAVTMQSIAEQVHVTRRTLFNYYATKDALLMSLLIHDFLNFVSELVQGVEQYPHLTNGKLRHVLITHLHLLYTPHHRALFKLIQARATLLANVDPATQQRDRTALVDSAVTLGQVIQLRLPTISTDQVIAIFYTENALILGYANLPLPQDAKIVLKKYHVQIQTLTPEAATVIAFENYLEGLLSIK